MICYLDRTFCSERACANRDCRCNFTSEHRKRAEEWWGGKDSPVAFSDLRDSKMCPGFKPEEQA